MLNAADILARAAAYAAHHRAMRRPAPSRLAAPGPAESIDALRRRMADDMRDIAAVSGSCEPADLRRRGWTAEAIRQHADAASDLAFAASERAL